LYVFFLILRAEKLAWRENKRLLSFGMHFAGFQPVASFYAAGSESFGSFLPEITGDFQCFVACSCAGCFISRDHAKILLCVLMFFPFHSYIGKKGDF